MGARSDAALRGDGPLGTPPAGASLPADGTLALGPAPAGYDLEVVARGHGAVAHPPSAHVDGVLHRVVPQPGGPRAVRVLPSLTLAWAGPAPTDPASLRASLRRQLCLDDDLEPLWAVCDASGRGWARAAGLGRVLRAHSVWEDAVGVLASARTSWPSACASLGRLVAGLGEAGPLGERAFPEPGRVAAAGAERLRAECGFGFRAAWVAALARSGLDLERWRAGSDLDDAEVQAQMLAQPGIGPFGAATLLALVGRPRGLVPDGWAARRLGLAPAAVTARYAPLGRWGGTVLWLDLRYGRPAVPGPGSGPGRPGRRAGSDGTARSGGTAKSDGTAGSDGTSRSLST